MSSSGLPWYRDGARWQDRASQYLAAYLALPPEAPQQAEVRSFREYSVARLIFESNRFENAGVPSESDTRLLITDAFPSIPDAYADFRAFLLPVGQDASRLQALLRDEAAAARFQERVAALGVQRPDKIPVPAVTFGNHGRSYLEVVRHYLAWHQSHAHTEAVLFGRMLRAALRLSPQVEVSPELEMNDVLLTESVLQGVHQTLSTDLLRPDAKVLPGQYRIDIRSVGGGEHIAFPAPALVPECMETFVVQAARLIGTASPWAAAAELSHCLTQIHPFPDFNGRLSRLVLSMVLRAYGVPFALALRADQRGKARYLFSLRRADRGQLDAFTTLIARTLVRGFEEIDRNLKLAGLQPLGVA